MPVSSRRRSTTPYTGGYLLRTIVVEASGACSWDGATPFPSAMDPEVVWAKVEQRLISAAPWGIGARRALHRRRQGVRGGHGDREGAVGPWIPRASAPMGTLDWDPPDVRMRRDL